VSANGGTITIDSEPGRGTCVSFTVPLAGSPCMPGTPDLKGTAGARKGRILLVEDEDSNLYLLNRILTREKYSVVCASNGVEAVELLKQHPDISLVLLDLQMPVMNGFDTIREIWRIRPGVPVIAQTGSSYPEDLREIKAAGFTNWIFKPVEKEPLLKMVANYLKADQS